MLGYIPTYRGCEQQSEMQRVGWCMGFWMEVGINDHIVVIYIVPGEIAALLYCVPTSYRMDLLRENSYYHGGKG